MGRKVWKRVLIVLFWLGVWTALALWVDNPILLATPARTAAELLGLLCERRFYATAAGSLLRISAGFLSGFAAAVLLAVTAKRFPAAEEVLAPMIKLLKSAPVASFVVLLLIWWGSSFLAVAVSFLVVLPNLYINTLEGLKNADGKLLEMAEVFRLPAADKFLYVYHPALKPFLDSGLRLSLGMCWKSGVAAEVIGTPDFSIGGQLYLSKLYLDTAGVLAWTAVVIGLSTLFERLVLRAAAAFFAWQPDCGGRRRQRRSGDTAEDGSGASQEAGRARKGRGEETPGGRKRREKAPGEGEPAAAIVVRGLCKSFDGERVLEGLDAVYRRGEVYYLRQPSGSGKTTLLRLLAGVLQPDSGEITVPCRVSMMFQEDRLCEAYSAVKNVELVCRDKGRARAALSELLETEALERPCALLSGGMKRRVALVRAVEADSGAVLLDEPFTGMDAKTRARAEAYIEKNRRGRIFIIATHI